MYFSEKVRLSSTSLSLMKLIGALNSLLVTVTQLYLITLCLFKSKTSVAEACQIGQIIGDFLRICHPIRYLDLFGQRIKILRQVHIPLDVDGFQINDWYPYSVPHSDSFPRHPLSRSPSRFLGELILPTGGGLSPSFNSVTIPLLK